MITQKSILYPLILSILLYFVHQTETNACNPDDDTLLMLVWVVDRTASYKPYRLKIVPGIKDLETEIKLLYSKTVLGMTSFSDWQLSAGPDVDNKEEVGRLHNLGWTCTDVRSTFVPGSVANPIATLPTLNSGGKENSLAALAWTSYHPHLKWEETELKYNERKKKRVFLLLTEQDYYDTLGNPGTRGDFKGDGKDDCNTTKPPTAEMVGIQLKKKEISVIAIYPTEIPGRDLVQIYDKYFARMPGVPYCGKGMDFSTFDPKKFNELVMGCMHEFDPSVAGCGRK